MMCCGRRGILDDSRSEFCCVGKARAKYEGSVEGYGGVKRLT